MLPSSWLDGVWVYGIARRNQLEISSVLLTLRCVFRVSQSDCEQLLELTADLYSRRDPWDWRPELLARLARLIPSEFSGCHFIRRRARSIQPCYHPEQISRPSVHGQFWRLVEDHPLNGFLFERPPQAWKLSDATPLNAFRNSELYYHLYRPLQVDCELVVVVPERNNPDHILLLSLHRGRVDFSDRDRALITLLIPHLGRLPWMVADRPMPKTGLPYCPSLEVFSRALQRSDQHRLTPRECEVLFWVYQGKTNQEIGQILGISERTAETHSLRAYPKLGVENRFGAISTLCQIIQHS